MTSCWRRWSLEKSAVQISNFALLVMHDTGDPVKHRGTQLNKARLYYQSCQCDHAMSYTAVATRLV